MEPFIRGTNPEKDPPGMTALGIFFLFGAGIALLAGSTLIWPGTILDRIWNFNPRAFHQLEPFGRTAGIPFVLLAVALSFAGLAWLQRSVWGWRLAVAIIATQIIGDLVNAFLGRIVEGGTGAIIAGALLLYLLRPPVRAAFHQKI
jgi:hypothetical protein